MNNNIRCLQTEDIKINCNPSFQKKTNSNFWKSLHLIWENFVKKLLADRNELQVWQKVDRHGNIYWQAYDPVTGKSFSSGSETDVSMWIEQLYRY
ncbi:MAG: hypothetical protein RMY64_15690 [Nostoc sp. DedQUE08]|uniref:hypothetical protein n=1 Tax=Nostoc sp. DedQUE08 TaxID=3075393 RepID=UPI002AD58EEF|nr:hypothetical protein [Nostoc sp. DedQUE08]MDZ8067039.1 hypothetical protein [Nostoc sp. DedQUE08]